MKVISLKKLTFLAEYNTQRFLRTLRVEVLGVDSLLPS